MLKYIPTVGLALLLAGCGAKGANVQADIATVSAGAVTVSQGLQLALDTYPIIKGMAQQAVLADPSLAPVINGAIAKIDPVVAQGQALLAAAVPDVQAIAALATALTQQTQALTQTAAPVIKVVPST